MKHIIWLLVMTLALFACTNAGAGDPARVVERYLAAKVTGDAETVQQLLCSEMESELAREQQTFSSVSDVRIEEMACTAENDTVSCQGTIVALYGAEETEFPLTRYRVVQEDGEWRWCGESN